MGYPTDSDRVTLVASTDELDALTYRLIDGQTGAILAEKPGSKRRALRNRAERMNLAYGAHRYYAAPVFT